MLTPLTIQPKGTKAISDLKGGSLCIAPLSLLLASCNVNSCAISTADSNQTRHYAHMLTMPSVRGEE